MRDFIKLYLYCDILNCHESFLFKGSSYEGDIRMGIVEIMEEETDGEDPEDENEEYRLQVQ